MLVSQAGCDTSFMKGKLFFKKGKMCLVASEE